MTLSHRTVAVALVVICSAAPIAGSGTAASSPGLVDPAVLQPLLPTPDGWTIGRQRSDRILNPDCTYSFAEVVLTRGDMNVRVTVADTDGNADTLMSLATMILTLPEDFIGEVPPATTVRRLVVAGVPAAERWSAIDKDGEFTVLIDKRFVVKAEGTRLDGVETLRRMVEAVDFKKVAALK